MKPNIDLTEKHRGSAVTILNTLLADEVVLSAKARNCHWNVTGPHFHDLHKLFGSQYDALDEIMDDMAERTRSLGGHAVGTLSELLNLARLKEQPGKYPNGSQMTGQLLAGHEALIRQLRKDAELCGERLGDAGTADFLTGVMSSMKRWRGCSEPFWNKTTRYKPMESSNLWQGDQNEPIEMSSLRC